MNKITMPHSKFPLSGTSKISPIWDEQNSPYRGQAKLLIVASALLITLFSFTSVFAKSKHISAEAGNIGIDTAYISWANSTVFPDSVDITITLFINSPDEGSMLEVRYGTTQGSGDLAAMDLRTVKENNQYVLVYDYFKFPVTQPSVTIRSRAEKAYLLRHDRYFNLKLKDKYGNQLKQITIKENH